MIKNKNNFEDVYYSLGRKSIYLPSIVKQEDLIMTKYTNRLDVNKLLEDKINSFRSKNVTLKSVIQSSKKPFNMLQNYKQSTNKETQVRNISSSHQNTLNFTLESPEQSNIKKVRRNESAIHSGIDELNKQESNVFSPLIKFNFSKSTINSAEILDEKKQDSNLCSPKSLQKFSQKINMNKYFHKYKNDKSPNKYKSVGTRENVKSASGVNIQKILFRNIKNNKELVSPGKKQKKDTVKEKQLFLNFLLSPSKEKIEKHYKTISQLKRKIEFN